MKRMALFGAVGAVGLIVQIAMGFVLAASLSSSIDAALLIVHMVIGVTGLALVAFLFSRVYFTSTTGVRVLYLITFVLVLVQVALGFRILAVQDQQLVMSHQGNAFAILVFLGLSEMLGARRRRKSQPSVQEAAPPK